MRSATTPRLAGVCVALAAVLLVVPAADSAAKTPATWRIDALSNSTIPAGSSGRLNLGINNVGDMDANGGEGDPITFTAALPPEMTVEDVRLTVGFFGVEDVSWNELVAGFFDPGWKCTGDGPGAAPKVVGAHHISCSNEGSMGPHSFFLGIPAHPSIVVHVAPSADGKTLTSHFGLHGAGAPEATTAEVTRITDNPTFGFDMFDMTVSDATGHAYTTAAAHPHHLLTNIEYNTLHNDRLPHAGGPTYQDGYPVETTKDTDVQLPPGMIGNPSAFTRCFGAQILLHACPLSAQVGTVRLPLPLAGGALAGPYPVFNMAPPFGTAARLAFNVFGVVVPIDSELRSDSDYGLSLLTRNISEGLDFSGFRVTTWGTPADQSNDFERSCPGSGPPEEVGSHGPTCESNEPELAFLRVPTSCTEAGEGFDFAAAMDSWEHPAGYLGNGRTPDLSDSRWQQVAIESHEAPGFPLPEVGEGTREWGEPVGTEDCANVPFEPSVTATPTTNQADSPTGLDVNIEIPQDCWGENQSESTCQSDLRKATVVLPKGVTVNPSAANGRQACSPGEVGLTTQLGATPIHFDQDPAECPNASKIGGVEIKTPLLSLHDSEGKPVIDSQGNAVLQTLSGSVYLAKQTDNPFNSLLALYAVVEDPETGVTIKLAGKVTIDEQTGQVTTVFDEGPQLPFESFDVELFSGPRAALRTPPSCGTYDVAATLTPWSGTPDVDTSSPFQITEGPAGATCPAGQFQPHLNAGTANPLAGAYSPFNFRVSRDDGTAELRTVETTLPPGLIGKLAGVGTCPDSAIAAVSRALGSAADQIAHRSCPASSELGQILIGAGSGPTPTYAADTRVYLGGPYKGAPYSLIVISPAVIGPFDFGSVVTRAVVQVNPDTAQISVDSDPLPFMLYGAPVDVRDLRMQIDRPEFTFNPTSCDVMSIDAKFGSFAGQTASASERFQAVGCERLGFKPKLNLQLKGAVHRRAHPRLIATYTARPGDANLARAQVKLPAAAQIDNAHFGNICTRPAFASHTCPAGSVYGKATATSPILGYPLSGPVVLRASPEHTLPDIVADLRGPDAYPVEIALAGKNDSVNGALRNTFESVPDAPVTNFRLELFGGSKGLVQMSDGFCAHPNALINLEAQNGRTQDFTPKVKANCGGAKKKHRRKKH